MEVPDLPAICKAAHARGVLVALDNTWSAGLALRGFDLGVDIIMQALTKYQSGGSDVLMGALITRDARAERPPGDGAHAPGDGRQRRRRLPGDARPAEHEAALRGARRRRAQGGGLARRRVRKSRKVLHPAFEDCPGHEIWKRDFTGAGGLFSVLFDAALHAKSRPTASSTA